VEENKFVCSRKISEVNSFPNFRTEEKKQSKTQSHWKKKPKQSGKEEKMSDPRSVNFSQWKGLLEWSMRFHGETTASDVHDMDPERREFLQKALEEQVVDPVDFLKALIALLKLSRAEAKEKMELDEEQFVDKQIEALRASMDIIEQIDWARDFVNLGGFEATLKLAKDQASPADLKASAFEVAAATVQNNPPCQHKGMELGLLSIAVDELRKPESTTTMNAKALLAVSCMVREHTAATVAFVKEHKGIALLMDIITGGMDHWGIRTQRKALFLMKYLLRTVPAIKPTIAESLVMSLNQTMLSQDIDLRENSMNLLITLYEDKNVVERISEASRQQTTQHLAMFAKNNDHFKEPLDEVNLELGKRLMDKLNFKFGDETEEPPLMLGDAQ